MPPILSIIIVAYKSIHEIGDCIASLPRTLQGRDVQIIIVDNYPQDGIQELIQSPFPHVTYIDPDKNLGFGKANNLGFNKSSGEHILFLNPDTIGNDKALEHCIARLQQDASIGLITPKLTMLNGEMDLACRRSIPSLWDGFCRASGLATRFNSNKLFSGYNLTHLPENESYEVGAINGAFMMTRRKDLEKIGLFDEDFFMYGDDLDLCYRFSLANLKIVYDGRFSFTHIKGQSVSKDYEKMSKAIFDTNKAFYLKHFNPRNRIHIRLKYNIAFGAWKTVALLKAKLRRSKQVKPV